MENIEWIFSGIGVFVLGIAFGFIKKYIDSGISLFDYKLGYYFPNTLSYFRHDPPIEEKIRVTARRILSIKILRSKEIIIKYPIFSSGGLNSAISLSDPGGMKMIQKGNSEGYNELIIDGKKGDQHIIASESIRSISKKEIRA